MLQLSKEEIGRYERHLILPGFGETAQLKLKAARVLVVGAGGLGCPALQYLAAAGVGTIGIIDEDRVSRSNLQRQILYADADVGLLKSEVAQQRLLRMNPDIQCESHAVRLTVQNALELIRQYDVVLDGSDNFATRYLVNDACVLAGKPLVYGALHAFQGQASVFNYNGGPTYRCLFPEPPNPEDAPNCSEAGVLGVLPGMIGVIQATEVIKLLTGIGALLSGQLLLLDALTMRQTIVRFERVPDRAEVTELIEFKYRCELSASTGARRSKFMSPQLLYVRLQKYSDQLQVIDVREAWERSVCRLDSVHVPLGTIMDGSFDLEAVGMCPERLTCVYCKSGVRSLQALEALKARYGFSDIFSLSGGILAWADAIDPLMERY